MKRQLLSYFFIFMLFLCFFPSNAKAETPQVLFVRYQYPYTIIEWTVSGCILIQAPQHPVVWPDESCRNGSGITFVSRDDTRENYRAVRGMKISLQSLDGTQSLAQITLDARAEYPYVVYLPLVVQ